MENFDNKSNIHLKKVIERFLKDYKMPFEYIDDESFEYYLDYFEREYKSRTIFTELKETIKDRFCGDIDRFLDNFYDTRESIVSSINGNVAFIRFNNMNLSKYSVPKLGVQSTPVSPIVGNEDKVFVTVDLTKANFQTLNYVDREIMHNSDTYEDFIGKFTDLDYIINSKYTRQVIFGTCNPKRTITVEKYLIYKAYEAFRESYGNELLSFCNDEFTVSGDSIKGDYKAFAEQVIHMIKEKTGIDVHCTVFKLKSMSLYQYTDEKVFDFVVKTYLSEDRTELKSVPKQFYIITDKLLKGIRLCRYDREFIYYGIKCRMVADFKLVEIR